MATVNHDAARGLRADELDEVEGEAAEPVAVGHHNLGDSACEDAFQKGTQAWAPPVDAGGNVEDGVLGEASLDDARLFRGGGHGDAGAELTLTVGEVVTPVPIRVGEPHATEIAPASQRGPEDI